MHIVQQNVKPPDESVSSSVILGFFSIRRHNDLISDMFSKISYLACRRCRRLIFFALYEKTRHIPTPFDRQLILHDNGVRTVSK